MKQETLEWKTTVSGGAVSWPMDTDSGFYSITMSNYRGDWWITFGGSRVAGLCNPVQTIAEGKEVAELHFQNQPAPASVRCGKYRGWNFPHPRWVRVAEETIPFTAVQELDATISRICKESDKIEPRGYKWDLHRDLWASDDIEKLVVSLGSSDEDEYKAASLHLYFSARECLAEWELNTSRASANIQQ